MAVFSPGRLDFGVVSLGASTLEEVMSSAFTSPAKVTAAVTADTSGGAFKIDGVTSYQRVKGSVDNTGVLQGKPVPGTDLEQIGHTDGITPLPVSKGQLVSVDVRFTAPAQSTDGARTATLKVNGDTWTSPVSIPLTALAGEIAMDIPPISIVQNQTVSVPVTVRLVGGPPTTVTLTTTETFNPPLPPGSSPLPPGIFLSVAPAAVQVSSGKPGQGVLQVGATRDAGAGTYTLAIYTTAFNGAMRGFSFQVHVGTLALRPSPIDQKYSDPRIRAILGAPTAPEAFCPDFHGQFRSYANGSIYWSGADGSGAFEVHGPVLNFWLDGSSPATGPAQGIGYPTTDVFAVAGPGTACDFQKGGIYSKPTTGTRSVRGPIFDRYAQLGQAGGVLGFPIIITPQQTLAILNALPAVLRYTLVLTCAATALRASEILSLRWADILWEESRIRISKRWAKGKDGETKTEASDGYVPLHPLLATHLRQWRQQTPYAKDADFVFASMKAKGKQPLYASTFVADYLRPAALKAGVAIGDGQRFGLHNLRHSLSNWLVNKAKVEPKTVQGILRHSKIQTTLDLYTQEDSDETRAAQGRFLTAVGITETAQ
jgi:hypothetical protein